MFLRHSKKGRSKMPKENNYYNFFRIAIVKVTIVGYVLNPLVVLLNTIFL